MADGIAKTIIRGIVESGTGIIVSQVAKTFINSCVPKRQGVVGMVEDICVTAARFAITFQATEAVGNYVDTKFDARVDSCKKLAERIEEIRNRNKEEAEDDKSEPEEVTNNAEASAD